MLGSTTSTSVIRLRPYTVDVVLLIDYIDKRENNMDSYKIYVDGILWRAFYSQSKFKAECHRLEEKFGVLMNKRGGCLQCNPKNR